MERSRFASYRRIVARGRHITLTTLIGGVLDQRMLEATVSLGRSALDEQEIGVGEPVQRCLQRRLINSATSRSSA
jgi:hypothetical protein